MLHILYGEDDFTTRELLREIKAECGGHELGEANITSLDGAKMTLDELLAACNTISFLAPKRLVIVEGLLRRFEQGSKRRSDKSLSGEVKDWLPLVDQVPHFPKSTILVLIEGNLNTANPLLKALTPVATIKKCIPPKGQELQNWIRSRVQAKGGKISPQAVRFLADLIGNNLWVLSSEIEKLCVHAGDRHIETDDIHQLVSYAKESNIFQMVDAIVLGRMKVSSLLMHRLIDDGSAPPYLLYMITRQFRLLIQARTLLAQGETSRKVGEKLGLRSEFVLDKTLEQARGYSLERLEGAYRKLLKTDLAIKTGTMEGELALDLLVADLCQEGAPL